VKMKEDIMKTLNSKVSYTVVCEMKVPDSKVSYSVICEKHPEPSVFFDSYELALKWSKIVDKSDNRPSYIVKRTECFELCENH